MTYAEHDEYIPCVIQQNDCTPADLFCDDADPYLVVIISTAVPDLAMHGVTHTQDVVSVFSLCDCAILCSYMGTSW